MTPEPKISVILPVYNSAAYVDKSIQSVLGQSYTNFELIIIDDGSTDQSADIISGFRDTRIHFYQNEKNLGLIATLNKGLQIAKGEFIARMDADDIALTNRFEKQIKFLTDNPDVGICGTYFTSFGNNHDTTPALPCTDDELRMTLLFRSAMAHPTVMIRKSVLDTFSLNYNANYPSAEDYKLWTDIATHSKLANVNEVLLHYRVHQNQITQTKVEQKENSLKKIHSDFLKAIGMHASIEELELQYRLAGGWGARSAYELKNTRSWLNKLHDHLVQIHFVPKDIIEKQLTLEWNKSCENSGLGRAALAEWRLCNWKKPFATFKDRSRFYFKIISQYKAH